MDHTKEPWLVHHDIDAGEWPMVMAGGKVSGVIVANVNPISFSCATAGNVEMPSAANARRIVACVNACAGMDDPAAEIEKQQARIADLEKHVEWWQSCTKDCGDVINDGISTRQQLRAENDQLRAKVAELERVSPRCECCGYLVHHSEHKGCIRAADKMAELVTSESAIAWVKIAEGGRAYIATGPTEGYIPVAAAQKLAELERQVEIGRRALVILEELEWSPNCPSCGADGDYLDRTHDNCKLDAILRDAEQAGMGVGL